MLVVDDAVPEGRKRTKRVETSSELVLLEKFVDAISARLSVSGELIYGDVTVDEKTYRLRQAQDLKLMLGMLAYYHVLWAPGLVSGNVEFAEVLAEGQPIIDDDFRKHVVMRVTPHRNNMSQQEMRVEFEDIIAVVKVKKAPSSYPSTVVVLGMAVVSKRLLLEAIRGFYGPEDREIADLIRRAASIAKSVAKSLVPVFGQAGQLSSMEVVGFEDMIFNQLIMHFLRERDRRRIEG